MKKLALLAVCLVFGIGTGWASVNGTTNPAQFNDWVNWCQFGCNAAQFPTPQSFSSTGGVTGEVGLVSTLQGFYNLQDGVSWGGGFPNGMGLIYNGASFGNTPTQIAVTFDTSVFGVGAYIQGNWIGVPYTASIELFDSSFQSLGVYTVDSIANNITFIGAFGSSPVWAAQFDLIDTNGREDFAIGSVGVSSVPEPSSVLLLGTSALGLAGYLRRRFL